MKQLHFWDRRQTEGIQGASGKQQVAIEEGKKRWRTVLFGAKRLNPSPEGRVWEGVTWIWFKPRRPGGRGASGHEKIRARRARIFVSG